MTQKTWLITGSGNGLGRNIAEAALKAGDNVVAGARRREELAPLVTQYGARVKPLLWKCATRRLQRQPCS
jgi:NAD(P)-dependent dehydrogenase (short-subunit alcohol dehydrogenase family)